jgi:hypothetical protein
MITPSDDFAKIFLCLSAKITAAAQILQLLHGGRSLQGDKNDVNEVITFNAAFCGSYNSQT